MSWGLSINRVANQGAASQKEILTSKNKNLLTMMLWKIRRGQSEVIDLGNVLNSYMYTYVQKYH